MKSLITFNVCLAMLCFIGDTEAIESDCVLGTPETYSFPVMVNARLKPSGTSITVCTSNSLANQVQKSIDHISPQELVGDNAPVLVSFFARAQKIRVRAIVNYGEKRAAVLEFVGSRSRFIHAVSVEDVYGSLAISNKQYADNIKPVLGHVFTLNRKVPRRMDQNALFLNESEYESNKVVLGSFEVIDPDSMLDWIIAEKRRLKAHDISSQIQEKKPDVIIDTGLYLFVIHRSTKGLLNGARIDVEMYQEYMGSLRNLWVNPLDDITLALSSQPIFDRLARINRS